MLWAILIALAIGGGHVLSAIFYAVMALATQRRRTPVIVATIGPTPSAPSPYEHAVQRQRARRFRVIEGRS